MKIELFSVTDESYLAWRGGLSTKLALVDVMKCLFVNKLMFPAGFMSKGLSVNANFFSSIHNIVNIVNNNND